MFQPGSSSDSSSSAGTRETRTPIFSSPLSSFIKTPRAAIDFGIAPSFLPIVRRSVRLELSVSEFRDDFSKRVFVATNRGRRKRSAVDHHFAELRWDVEGLCVRKRGHVRGLFRPSVAVTSALIDGWRQASLASRVYVVPGRLWQSSASSAATS